MYLFLVSYISYICSDYRPYYSREASADGEDGSNGEKDEDGRVEPGLPLQAHGQLDEKGAGIEVGGDLGEHIEEKCQERQEDTDALASKPGGCHYHYYFWRKSQSLPNLALKYSGMVNTPAAM